MLAGRFKDFLAANHDAQIDHVKAITLQNDANDVFANIVHIALYRGHQDLTCCLILGTEAQFFLFHVRQKVSNGLLHHASGFHHLRQEHFARAKQVTNHVHPVHQRAFNHVQRPLSFEAGGFCIFDDKLCDAMHQRMGQTLPHRGFTPG